MNIAEKTPIWTQFKFQLPMLICAIWVIAMQRKLIWSTLKMWWSWGFSNWPPERIEYLKISGVGVVAFIVSILGGKYYRDEVVVKQQQEVVAKMLEEKIITQEDLEKQTKKEQERERVQNSKKKSVNLPFYNISPFFCFITVCLIAPLGEEAIFRYLIFEIFDKKILAYICSGLGFIFFHWMGPTLGFGGGLLNFTTLKFLLITYLPMTIFLIYAYRKSKWNITYPMYFHMTWNCLVFFATIAAVN